jgi:hypothetical protein
VTQKTTNLVSKSASLAYQCLLFTVADKLCSKLVPFSSRSEPQVHEPERYDEHLSGHQP